MASHTLLTLTYPASCIACNKELPQGTKAWWDPSARTATCLACEVDNQDAPFIVARSTRRDIAVGSAVTQDRRARSNPAAEGPARQGRLTDYLRAGSEERFIVFDHRVHLDSRAGTDYIAVAPSGVYVIDAKNYGGKAQRKVRGLWPWRSEHLIVGDADETGLTAGMARQTAAVAEAVRRSGAFPDVPIISVLCLTGSDDWGVLAPTFTVNSVHVLGPRPLRELLRGDGPLTETHRAELARLLSAHLPLPPA